MKAEGAGSGTEAGSADGAASGAHALEQLWYSPSAAAAAARAALSPLSLLFGAGVRLRSELYDRGLGRVERAGAPVVSVGGLRVGGAGKTPFVLWLVRELVRRGRRPCIVTRGYAAAAGSPEPWVLDRPAALAPDAAARAGDEAVLLALRSGVPVAIGADRARACSTAAAELARRGHAPDLFVLDDGFQHRRLARDLDIVLVSGREEAERLLPAGPLREPVAALARADAVVTMRDAANLHAGAGYAGAAGDAGGAGTRFEAFVRVRGLVASAGDAETTDVAGLAGRRVVAVVGIARPERFLAALRSEGASIVATILRRDHHRYSEADRREIDEAARGADFVVTTEKDLVKLSGSALGAPLVALRIDVAFASDAAEAELADRAARLQPV